MCDVDEMERIALENERETRSEIYGKIIWYSISPMLRTFKEKDKEA
jgi:hypothetical protein